MIVSCINVKAQSFNNLLYHINIFEINDTYNLKHNNVYKTNSIILFMVFKYGYIII